MEVPKANPYLVESATTSDQNLLYLLFWSVFMPFPSAYSIIYTYDLLSKSPTPPPPLVLTLRHTSEIRWQCCRDCPSLSEDPFTVSVQGHDVMESGDTIRGDHCLRHCISAGRLAFRLALREVAGFDATSQLALRFGRVKRGQPVFLVTHNLSCYRLGSVS